jgi:signal transduction histidine kinase
LPKEPVSVHTIVTKAVDITAAQADLKHIKVETKLPKSNDLHVMGDQASLTELLVILLDNAVKFSPKDTKIAVKVHKDLKHVELSITDMGVGITADDLPHIFDRFYRADTSRTSGEAHGYGLGLALAQKIAHLHNGNIAVVSKVEKGSTFTVTLPIV